MPLFYGSQNTCDDICICNTSSGSSVGVFNQITWNCKDIGLPDELVVDCNNLTNDKAYTEAYKYLIVHEQEIRQIYDGMDEYIKGHMVQER